MVMGISSSVTANINENSGRGSKLHVLGLKPVSHCCYWGCVEQLVLHQLTAGFLKLFPEAVGAETVKDMWSGV